MFRARGAELVKVYYNEENIESSKTTYDNKSYSFGISKATIRKCRFSRLKCIHSLQFFLRIYFYLKCSFIYGTITVKK